LSGRLRPGLRVCCWGVGRLAGAWPLLVVKGRARPPSERGWARGPALERPGRRDDQDRSGRSGVFRNTGFFKTGLVEPGLCKAGFGGPDLSNLGLSKARFSAVLDRFKPGFSKRGLAGPDFSNLGLSKLGLPKLGFPGRGRSNGGRPALGRAGLLLRVSGWIGFGAARFYGSIPKPPDGLRELFPVSVCVGRGAAGRLKGGRSLPGFAENGLFEAGLPAKGFRSMAKTTYW